MRRCAQSTQARPARSSVSSFSQASPRSCRSSVSAGQSDRSRFSVAQSRRRFSSSSVGQTLTEKIVQKFVRGEGSKGRQVRAGDYVEVEPLYVMTHDNTSAVMKKFNELFPANVTKKIAKPQQLVYTLDHNIQDKTPQNLEKYKKIEDFAKKNGIDFYPAGRGIGHQIMCEEGYVMPETMVVASDSHSNMYGGLGCLGTPIVRTDAAAIWATSTTWWQVPPVSKVVLTGKLRPGVTGKDIIITLCGLFKNDEVLNHCVEFEGPAVSSLSIDDRLTIANMTTEWGTLAGLFPADNSTLDWLASRIKEPKTLPSVYRPVGTRITPDRLAHLRKSMLRADENAHYAKVLHLDLSTVEPYASGPNHVKVMASVRELQEKNIKIHKAYIVSCVNSRASDLKAAAEVLKGKKIAPGVEMYISAASSEVQKEAEQVGYWNDLVDSGAKTLPAGCGPCIGLGTGLLQDGEVGISATNRNFKGRMGSRSALAYLASPAVVAASAIAGTIALPNSMNLDSQHTAPKYSLDTPKATRSQASEDVSLLDGFQPQVSGGLLFCRQDNLNTDGIYAGKHTYVEVDPAGQAAVVMENYDPTFGNKAKAGDILLGGFNFGTGSSREQAATALKHKGIRLVLAGSFSETYKRNALNNGLLVIEVPELTQKLQQQTGQDELTVRGKDIKVDFKASTITYDGTQYAFSPVGTPAQRLILEGGLENTVRNQLAASK